MQGREDLSNKIHFQKFGFSRNTATIVSWLAADYLAPSLTTETPEYLLNDEQKSKHAIEEEKRRKKIFNDSNVAASRLSKIANGVASQILAAANNFDRNGSAYINQTMSRTDGNASTESEVRALLKAKVYIDDLSYHVWEALSSGSSFLLPLKDPETGAIIFYPPRSRQQDHYLNGTVVLDIDQALSSRLGLKDYDSGQRQHLFARNGQYLIRPAAELTNEINVLLEASSEQPPAPNLVKGMPILVLDLGTRQGAVLRSPLESAVSEAQLEADLYKRAQLFLRNAITLVSVANARPEIVKKDLQKQQEEGWPYIFTSADKDTNSLQLQAVPLSDGKDAAAIAQIATLFPDISKVSEGSNDETWSHFVTASVQRIQRTFETYISQNLKHIVKELNSKIILPKYITVTFMLNSEVDRLSREKAAGAEQALKILEALKQLDPQQVALDWEAISRFLGEKISGLNLGFSGNKAQLQRELEQLQARYEQSSQLISELMTSNQQQAEELAEGREKITIQAMENDAKLAQVAMGNEGREKIKNIDSQTKTILAEFGAQIKAQLQAQAEQHDKVLENMKHINRRLDGQQNQSRSGANR